MKLRTVNNIDMTCAGSTTADISLGGVTTRVDFVVSPALKQDILLSWHDLIKLKVLPSNFPAGINEAEIVENASSPKTSESPSAY